MSAQKKGKFFTKTSSFQGKTVKLFSIDGVIWSTRSWELEKIQERHEAERVKLDPADTAVAEGDESAEKKEVVEETAIDAVIEDDVVEVKVKASKSVKPASLAEKQAAKKSQKHAPKVVAKVGDARAKRVSSSKNTKRHSATPKRRRAA
jgi:hypothetical protein